MRSIGVVCIFVLVILCFGLNLSYSQIDSAAQTQQIKYADVNNDGTSDVTYYSDGKFVTKVEADTNYDGKSDVTVKVKDGVFQSAQADTDHDGKVDKEFSEDKDFRNWVNENHPDFNNKLNRANWQHSLLDF